MQNLHSQKATFDGMTGHLDRSLRANLFRNNASMAGYPLRYSSMIFLFHPNASMIQHEYGS